MDSYLFAVTPPEEIQEKVDAYRKKFARHTYSIVPHITLYPPFVLTSINEKELVSTVKERTSAVSSGCIVLDSIGVFANGGNHNVIYFKPNDSSQAYIRSLFDILLSTMDGIAAPRYSDYQINADSFKPHMTISSDVSDGEFPHMREELLKVTETFEFPCTSIDLYREKGDSGVWSAIAEIPLVAPK